MDNRGIILEALLLYERGEDFADRILKNTLDKYSYLHKFERSFISRVYTGTIERLITLDYIIDIFSTVKTSKQKPVIRNILRMSVYQLVFMDSVPDSAVINEAVKLAGKKKFTQLKGFVNGILRKTAKEKDNIKYPGETDENYLSVKYSCPEWICSHFVNELGLHKTEQVLENSLKPRPLIIRTNLSKISKKELKDRLVNEGVTVKDIISNSIMAKNSNSAESPDDNITPVINTNAALILEDYDILTELESFKEGFFTVQDLSSQQVASALDLMDICKQGDMTEFNNTGDTSEVDMDGFTVVDVCAAPGGKTCHISDRLLSENISARVISRDISADKVEKINENVTRCGFSNIKTEVYDALALDESLINKADIVIADLPCSGLGVISRKVDIKYRLTPFDLTELSNLQRDILSVISQYVKPGGRLIYSTCTVNKTENENNAEWITESLPFDLCKPYIKLLNDNENTDGFFIAEFRRRQ